MSIGADVLARLEVLAADPGDPVDWVRERLGEQVWSRQADVMRAVRDRPRVAVKAANSVGKSHGAARLATWWIDSHPVGEAFVLTTAPSQSQVDVIVWGGIRTAHAAGGLRGRIGAGANPTWKIGDTIVGLGRKSQDLASPEEAAAAFQGIHARFLLVIIDEAAGVPAWLWEAIESMAISEHSRVLAIGNPTDPGSHFARVCEPGSGWQVLQVSAFDAPAFTGEDVPSELAEQLANPGSVDRMRRAWGEGSARWTSRVLGEFPDEADDALIARAWLQAAHRRQLPEIAAGWPCVFGADIARYGSDDTVVYANRGGRVRLARRAHGNDLMASTGVVARLLAEEPSPAAEAVVDAIGVGAGVFDRLREQGAAVRGFVASERASRPDRFVNRRAEVFWWLREALRDGLLDLDPADEALAEELLAIRVSENSRGLIQVEGKDELRRRLKRSPDRADAAAMTLVGEWRPAEPVDREAEALRRIEAAARLRRRADELGLEPEHLLVLEERGSLTGDMLDNLGAW